MGLDLDAWRAANLGTWTLTLDGYTYHARPVSARAVAALIPAITAAQPGAQFALYGQLFRLAFPWVPSYLWRGDPVAKILALEPAAFREVRDDFFDHLGRARKSHAPETSMTPSPTST